MAKISVIVACYNVSEYINECLRSIKEQSEGDFECIIVDDGSMDFSYEISKYYESRDRRFKVVRHDVNKGLAEVRSTGFKNARGKYVIHIDGDDFLERNALELLSSILDRHGGDIVRGNLCYYLESKRIFARDLVPYNLICNSFENIDILHWRLFGVFLNMFRRSFLEKIDICNIEKNDMGEDYIYNSYCYAKSNGISTINVHIYNYRRREGSFTAKKLDRDFLGESISHKISYKNMSKFPNAQILFMVAHAMFRKNMIFDCIKYKNKDYAIRVIENYKYIYKDYDPYISYKICKNVVNIPWDKNKNPHVYRMLERLHYVGAEEIYERVVHNDW